MNTGLRVSNPFRGVRNLDLQVNYTWSRFVSDGGSDQHFTPNAWDFRNPTAFMGPTSQDRAHQFKFGDNVRVCAPRSTPQPDWRLCFASAFRVCEFPVTRTTGEIFRSDLTGDGTTGDFLNSAATGVGHPGTFMRSVSPRNLNAYITNFNNTVGNGSTLTPAGQALVTAGLFTPGAVDQLWVRWFLLSSCRPRAMQGTAITKTSTQS